MTMCLVRKLKCYRTFFFLPQLCVSVLQRSVAMNLMNFDELWYRENKNKKQTKKSSADAAFTHFMFCVRELIAFCMPMLGDYRYMNSGLLPCFQTTNLQAASTCCSLGISRNQGDARFRAGRFPFHVPYLYLSIPFQVFCRGRYPGSFP